MTRVSTNNIGVLLAIVAGCSELGEAMWPGSAPQAESLNLWLPLAIVTGCACLLSAYLADRHTWLARVLLLVGGVLLVGSGLYFGALSGGGTRSAWAALADLGPGIAALVAALLIGPLQRHVIP